MYRHNNYDACTYVLYRIHILCIINIQRGLIRFITLTIANRYSCIGTISAV